MFTAPYTVATQALVDGVKEGDEKKVVSAIDSGADVNATLPPDDSALPDATVLTLAAIQGHAHLVPHLLKAGVEVNDRGTFPFTPLHMAAHFGHHQVLEALLPWTPDINVKDIHGVSPLHLAARRGRLVCAQRLIKAGAILDARDKALRTPLHFAVLGCSTDVMQLLLDSGCNRSALTNVSFSAMHLAAISGNERAVQHLLEAGLDLADVDDDGLSPEEVAEAWGRHNTAWLIRKMPKKRERATPTPTHTIMSRSWQEYEREGQKTLTWIQTKDVVLSPANAPQILEACHEIRDLHYQDASGLTPLHWAAKLGHTDIAKKTLISCGVLPHVVTYDGESPADLARQRGHHHLANMIRNEHLPQQSGEAAVDLYGRLLAVISAGDNVMTASLLLRSGSPLEPVGDFYTSVLVLAITCNRPKIVSLLVAAGAPLTTCSRGLSLLQLAWRTHDVTIRVRVLITRQMAQGLEAERRRVGQDSALGEGIDHLVRSLRGATTWVTSWPLPHTNLTSLMVVAATNNCPLTASFLRQAGAKCYLQDDSGTTPLHAALDRQHWHLATLMVKHMRASLYIPDSSGRLPLHLLPLPHRTQVEQSIYQEERQRLEELIEKAKDKEEKEQLREVVDEYDVLFIRYQAAATPDTTQPPPVTSPHRLTILSYSLLVSCRRGLLQLTYLLVTVVGVKVDVVVDATHESTALHQAASHGNSGCLVLLLSLGATPLQRDRYGHTPSHFAAMFGHDVTYQQLEPHLVEQEPVSKAQTTPSDIQHNFKDYLYRYRKTEVDPGDAQVFNDPSEGIKKLLNLVNVGDIFENLDNFSVDFSKREAMEVKEVVTGEVQKIMDKVSGVDKLYKGRLTTVGSSADGTRLYAPDEFDLSVVLSDVPVVSVEIVEQDPQQAALTGHRLKVLVKTDHRGLQGKTLINRFYKLVRSCLETHTLEDIRLSLVTPGVTRTQVGVALSFAWQEAEYPLLLIGVDLVPVLAVPWPTKEIIRPPLTPVDISQVYLSSTDDGEWRCSFAGAEAEVLSHLDPQERRIYLACKTLLSHLKAEPWMPREVKANYMWWDAREWKIMIPGGFAVKNTFLRHLQRKREQQLEWRDEHLVKIMLAIMRDLCHDFQDPTTSAESLVPAKVYAYFGGEFEKPKMGEGAPAIIKALTQLEQSQG